MLLGESDPIKLALLSPGVTPAVEGSASMVVRGGETDGNLIMIDGVPLYNSAHLFGYLSVFDDDAISRRHEHVHTYVHASCFFQSFNPSFILN